MTTVAIIPARGGSTRIPRKNICTLAGIPLIAHTIRAALGAAGVDGVFVSTDDREIAEAAAAHGAEVIWRPARLATAEAPTEPALQHAVTEIEANFVGRPVERIVLLQATSPLRGAARIDEALELMQRTGCDSVVSVVPEIGYYFLGDLGPDQRLRVGYDPLHRLRTQEIPPRYRENGAVYVMTRAQLMERGCRMGRDMRALIMGEDESIDIDTPRELELCRLVLAERARQQTQEQAA